MRYLNFSQLLVKEPTLKNTILTPESRRFLSGNESALLPTAANDVFTTDIARTDPEEPSGPRQTMYLQLTLLVVSVSVMENMFLASRSSSNSTRSDPFTVILKFLSRVVGRPRCALASKTSTRHRDITDDMMLEILSRVPGRSLVRLRLVCKRWASMFSEPHFIRLQLGYASKNPTTFLFDPHYCWDPVTFSTFELSCLSETKAHSLVLGSNFTPLMHLKRETNYRISNACDGLIVLYGVQGTAYMINPCTREQMDLPNGGFHNYHGDALRPVIGLGFDVSIAKYKAVRMFFCNDRMCLQCEVLTVGTDHSWRSLGDAPYPICCYHSPVYANGYIYWTIQARVPQGSECILSFDVSREKFTTIQLPQFRPKHNTAERRLFIKFLDGSLCLVVHQWCFDIEGAYCWPLVDIHVLKNHDESIWEESHSMCLKGDREKNICSDRRVIKLYLGAILNGKVLLHQFYKTNWRLYDPKTGSSSDVILPVMEDEMSVKEVMAMRSFPFTCAESIVPIKSLGTSPLFIT